MTVEETIDKLIQIKLPHMAKALRELLDRAPGSALSVDECVGLMVDREWTERENRRTGRRIKEAKLGMQACLEDVRCDPNRNLDKAVLRSLSVEFGRPTPRRRPSRCRTYAKGLKCRPGATYLRSCYETKKESAEHLQGAPGCDGRQAWRWPSAATSRQEAGPAAHSHRQA
jgi:IstB-like ATP binding protein